MSPRIFALVDCNNFYVSCERVFMPSLAGKPVVVISHVGGCALARSNEAKALGVLMGQPYFEWEALARKHAIKLFAPNFPLYGDLSNRVMKTLSTISPDREVYSIDECFLDITHVVYSDPSTLGQTIRSKVMRTTGIPVSVGIAPTKTLAKIAGEIAKKSPALRGVHTIDGAPDALEHILAQTPVEDVWGIGRQTATKLHIHGIHTAADFTHQDGEWVRKTHGVGFFHTWQELRGIACIEGNDLHDHVHKKSIMCTRTWARAMSSLQDLEPRIAQYTALAAEKLRRDQLTAQYVTVFIRTSRFVDRERRLTRDMTLALPESSAYTPHLTTLALQILKKIFVKGYEYKRAGIILSGFEKTGVQQMGIAGETIEARAAGSRLMRAIDHLNLKHGAGLIHSGYALLPKESASTGPTSDVHSPRYTTDWRALKKVT